ncbi:MAG: hypothetical protein Q4C12_07120 [Clostridia bacterium]|nr:hypothetical protein [Clostridia bacterium]
MENFKEYLVAKEPDAKDTAAKILIWLVIVVFIAFPILNPSFFPILALAAVAVLGAVHLTRGLRKEFEYIVTMRDIDIDIISGQRSRKRLASFNMDQMEICASVNDGEYASRINGSFTQTIHAEASKNNPNNYFAIFTKDGERTLLFFTPPEHMLNTIFQFVKSKIHIKK